MSRPRRRRQQQQLLLLPILLAMICLLSILVSQSTVVQSFSSSSSSTSSTAASGIGGVGSNHHSHSPIELDVESKPTCDYNSRSGIAGDIGTHYYVVEYHYQMILNTSTIVLNGDNGGGSLSFQEPKNWNDIDPNSLQDIVLSIEFEVAAFLLKESSVFEDAPCNNGRRRRRSTRRRVQQQQKPVDETVSSIGTTGNGDYSLVNVGMTVGPDDEILGQCSSSGSDELQQQQQQDVVMICYEVIGYFQVYTVGESTDTTSAQQNLVLKELKRAMDNGRLDNSHDAVVSISYVDKNNDTSDTMENTEDNSEEIPKQPNDDSSTSSSSSSGNSQSSNNPFGATSSENSSSSSTMTTTLAPSASAAIIVVATVGSVLLVVGVVLLRRRDIVERGNLTSSSSTSVVVATTGNNNINNSRNLSCRSQNIEDSVITDTSNLHDMV